MCGTGITPAQKNTNQQQQQKSTVWTLKKPTVEELWSGAHYLTPSESILTRSSHVAKENTEEAPKDWDCGDQTKQ